MVLGPGRVLTPIDFQHAFVLQQPLELESAPFLSQSAEELLSMQLVYITLEYCAADLFSGNGICSRSQVRRLAERSEVHVICGRPCNAREDELEVRNITLSTIPLETWFTTDRNSAHGSFARGASRILDELDWSSIDACFAVDWTGISQDDREFYKLAEGNAVRCAVASGGGVVALCDDDWRTLKAFTDHASAIRVILPMLRAEFSNIATRHQEKILDFRRKRLYLVSLVRLSEDKGPHRFVQLIRDIQANDPTLWERVGVLPLLCGAASQPKYAEQVKQDLCKAVPNAVVIDRFLTPGEMAELLQNAVLNVHSALYEAYGLTIVESAAMGCPSVIHCEGVGAAQLLRPVDGTVEAVDILDRAMFAARVKSLLEDDVKRNRLAYNAYIKATSWSEQEYVTALEDFAMERLAASGNIRVVEQPVK